jgi:hypothetical protein
MLVSWVTVGLECGDQSAQSRREDDQITGIGSGGVGMSDTRRYEYRRSGPDSFGSVGIPKSQFAAQDVPRFVVGMVDVKRGRAAAAPLMDPKRRAGSGETRRLHTQKSKRVPTCTVRNPLTLVTCPNAGLVMVVLIPPN